MKLKYPTQFIGITKGFRPKKYPTHSGLDLRNIQLIVLST